MAQETENEVDVFMAKAGRAAIELSPVITKEIERKGLDPGIAIVAVLLYASSLARRIDAHLGEFMGSCEQAFIQAEDLFAPKPTEVLRAARKLLERGWCQGELAMKWMKDRRASEGKRLINCHVADGYSSRWSLLGAIDAAAYASMSQPVAAREAVLAAIRETGYKVEPGALTATVITEYNDVGWAPPIPELKLPPLPDGASEEAKIAHASIAAELRHNYETVTVPQWPKPKQPGRTKEEVLAVLDRAITLSVG